MRQTEPSVKERANLEGERMMVGRKRKKARKRKMACKSQLRFESARQHRQQGNVEGC